MGVYGEEPGSCRVAAGDDEVRADVALVAEEVLFEHGHGGDDARGAARGEGVQFEVGGDERCGEFGVGGGAGAGAPDSGGEVVEFFAVLEILKGWVSKDMSFEVLPKGTMSGPGERPSGEL